MGTHIQTERKEMVSEKIHITNSNYDRDTFILQQSLEQK